MGLNTQLRGEQISDTSISGAHIIDGVVTEAKLDVYNSPTDGYVLLWNSTQSKFEWGTLGDMICNEVPSGSINGSNTVFTLANTPVTDSLSIFLNGLLQEPGAGNDYNLSTATITFTTAPESGDILLANYLTASGLAAASTANNVELDPTPDNNEASGIKSTVTVDTNATGIGSALYMASDGHFDEADADAAATMPCTALALETGTGSKEILHYGYIRNDTWNWTPGGLLYVSTTAGGLTQATVSGSGDQVQVVGYATHADRLFFSPDISTAEVS